MEHDDADVMERAHIKGQLQGLRAALTKNMPVRQPSQAAVATPPQPTAQPPPTPGPHAAEERNKQLEIQLKEMQLQLQLDEAQAKIERAAAARKQQQQQRAPQAFEPPPYELASRANSRHALPPRSARAAAPAAERPSSGRRDASPGPRGAPLRVEVPRDATPPRAPPSSAAPAAGNSSTPQAVKKKSNKSDCVSKVEEMQKLREERRRKAAEKKNARAEEVAAAEGMGLGIESVDFLNKIKQYKDAHNLAEIPMCVAGFPHTRRAIRPTAYSDGAYARLGVAQAVQRGGCVAGRGDVDPRMRAQTADVARRAVAPRL